MNISNIVKPSPHFKIIFIFNKNTNMTNAFNGDRINFSYIINKPDHYYSDCDKFKQWKTQMGKFFSFYEVFVDKQILIATKYFCE